MKSKKVLLTALFLTLLLMLIPACDDGVIVPDDNSSSSSSSDSSSSTAVSSSSSVASSSSSSSASSSSAPAASGIKKVYSEEAGGEDIVLDSVWEVWESTVTTFNELAETGADGGNAIIQVLPSGSNSWFGFVIRSDSKAENLTGYNYLIVNLRTTNMSSTAIEIGVGTPATDENWFSLNMNGKTDGNWHKFVIELSNVNLSSVDWLFAMRNGDYSSGTVDFDNIYYSTNDPGDGETVTPPVFTKKKVYSEITTAEAIPLNPSWQVWSGTITTFNELAETGADGGNAIIQVVPNPGSGWFGFVIRTLSATEDLTGFNYLKFSLRTTDMNSTAVEIGVGTPSTDEHWYSANMSGKTDGAWYDFVIDISAVNLSSVEWAFAMRNGSYTSGNVDFDNVYFSTTP